ncbi:DUF1015 domain-containing protein [Flavobacterium sp. CYK-55]|uniref:DUF1015 domain-containing protein n=1 Tax=Flavobacterium sp. CYK-55 TaxID=2835529 RepID=UPI001BCFFAAD|nr:DUF1015 domain-containing protein [Flavobacterium sp. CYK-55]MBS7786742.1 DUF1015 domain-containing protein [Flavobacterium sp. CYK-55]
MSQLIPFKAVRPTPDKVGLVTCRTYDDYSPAELAAWLDFNPFSFLHVLNPAYVNAQKIGLEKRFKNVAHKYHDFKAEGVFVQDETPCIYLYEIKNKLQSFTGFVAGTSIADYQNNIIKKHEDTFQYRVELFKDYLHQTRFNTEPVLIMYPDQFELNHWIQQKKTTKSLYEFSTTNKEKHTLWKIEQADEIFWLQKQFEQIPELYIADGHHRSASAEMLYEQDRAQGDERLDFFMSFLIAESDIKIYEFNRMVRDLNGWSAEAFLEKLNENFIVKEKGHEVWKPESKYEFGMYLNGTFYALFYRQSTENSTEILDNLDAQILYDQVLKPLLGIYDLRNDERIDYLPGKQSIHTLKEIIDEGEFDVAFMLYPTAVSEIKALADASLIMPPKSTYIEPKFRSGLLIYEL